MGSFAERMALSKSNEELLVPSASAPLPQRRILPAAVEKPQNLFPQVDANIYRLSVTGLVKKALSLSLDDIYEEFPKVTITSMIQDDRREYCRDLGLYTARWAGIRLRHVLLASGIEPEAQKIEFIELTGQEISEAGKRFDNSIPLRTAFNPDILLAYEIDGEPLSAEQGFPVCIIAPKLGSTIRARWVKEIRVSANISECGNLYRQTNEIKAIISTPRSGETVLDNVVVFEGYAISDAGRPIHRVELSADNGKNWTHAQVLQNASPGEWSFWEGYLKLSEGAHQVIVRAWDADANVSASLHGIRIRVVEDE